MEALKQTPSLKSNKKVSFFAGNQFVRTIFEDLVGTQVDDLDHELLVDVQEEINDLMEKICSIMDKVGTEFIITQNQELKRYLHTVKGSAKMAGANKIGGVAHRLETLLEYSERHSIALYQMHNLIAGELEKISFLFNHMGSTLDESRLRWLDLVDLGNDEEEVPVTLTTEKNTVLAEKDFIISAGVEDKKETQPVFSSERLIRVSSCPHANPAKPAGPPTWRYCQGHRRTRA